MRSKPIFDSGATKAAHPASGNQARKLSQAAFGVLLVAVIWAPWPLGSNRTWALALLGGLVWLGVLLASAGHLYASGRSRRPLVSGWYWPVLALAAFALLLVAQIWPGLAGGDGTLSVSPFDTRQYLFASLTFSGGWVLVLMCVNSAKRIERLMAAVFAAGLLQAVTAIALAYSGARYQLWLTDFAPDGRATGTFASPDHLAGYMELTLAAGLGWLLMQFQGDAEPSNANWQSRLSTALRFILSPKMLLRLLLLLLVIALVMTHSRMGNGAFFFTLLLVGVVLAISSQRLRKPAMWLVASMVVIDVFIIGQLVGLDRVVQRLQDTASASMPAEAVFGSGALPPPKREESIQERLRVPELSLPLVAQRPWLGHGGGTYAFVLPPLKEQGMTWFWTNAHNDYVEVAVNTGLVGLALWLLPGLLTMWRAMRHLPDRQTSLGRGVGLAALIAISCMALHSIVDFNMHIPANAFTFSVLLALVWTVGSPSSTPRA